MIRPSLAELEILCQKPDHRHIGNWMARRVARPAALRVTWLILPWGLSAHAVTLEALLCGAAGAAALAWGSLAGWLLGAALLQCWYLLDHVDGQVARYRRTASLDGVQLDYLMHHVINLIVPFGAGWGLFAAQAEPAWLVAGFSWGLGALLMSLQNDARCKAFEQRLKRVVGELRVECSETNRPRTATTIPWKSPRAAMWIARKLCEPHVTMNLIGAVALAELALGNARLVLAQVAIACMAVIAPAVTVFSIARSVARGSAEQQFASWYHPPADRDLVYDGGWWRVVRRESDKLQPPGPSR